MSKSELPVVVALHRINGGKHLPNDIFVAASQAEHDELVGLGAVRDANEDEIAVYQRLQAAGAQTPAAAPSDPFDHDGDGKPGGSKPRRGRGRAAQTEAAAEAEAEAPADEAAADEGDSTSDVIG